ncbi:hypothetical protein F5Y19DRAFT_484558 [Xylariaceae sp. FL1651]|nr:hypothetical protein F5Y19DRAFT_484558 [Xylariaceae sp. FL1651]
MDVWTSTSQQDDLNVYLGLWTNWSHGRIMGSTLTLTRSHGALVIAFAAFFVTIIASRFWRMACIVIHYTYSRPGPELHDIIYHHRQTILRNSPSATSGLWTLVQVLFAHRKFSRHLFIRIFPILLFSLICLSGFTTLTYFLPQIAMSVDDQVLLVGNRCGQIDEAAAVNYNYSRALVTLEPYISSKISNAENYARQCYSGSGQIPQCSTFVSNRIPSTVNTTAGCPFHPDICRLNNSNIRLDTGFIDLRKYYGVNNPVNEDMSVRQTLHCAPLVTEGYTSTNQTEHYNLTIYHYGSYRNRRELEHPYLDGTIEFISIEGQYDTTDWGRYKLHAYNFQLHSLVVNGTMTERSEFQPIPHLQRGDSDLSIVFLSGAGTHFLQPSLDPWYRATTPDMNAIFESGDNYVFEIRMDGAASPMGCAIQWQFCQPGPSGALICGDLASFNDATSSFLRRAVRKDSKLYWYLNIFSNGPALSDVIGKLNSQSLTSQTTMFSGAQGPIPENQWQLDVAHWWATLLAAAQASFIDTVTGPPIHFQIPSEMIRGPMDADETAACGSQKIRSTTCSSFNMFGLAFFFVAGSLIVVASLALEPLLAALHDRWGYQQHAYLEWVSQETLQLQRLAHEELGFGTWSGATSAIPTVELGDKLAGLDATDPKHPRLRVAVPKVEDGSDTANSGSENVNTDSLPIVSRANSACSSSHPVSILETRDDVSSLDTTGVEVPSHNPVEGQMAREAQAATRVT